VHLFACPDVACTSHFPGSPAVVSYIITVAKPFGAEYSLYDIGTYGTIQGTADVKVQLPPGETTFTATASETWLTVVRQTATGFIFTTSPMPIGTYFATITIRSGNRAQVVVVRYNVGWLQPDNSWTSLGAVTWVGDVPSVAGGDFLTPLAVKSDVSSLTFQAAASGSAPARDVTLTLPAGSTALTGAVYSLGPVPKWLSLNKTGEHTFRVVADAAALTPGLYRADLIFQSGTEVSPKVVPVLFNVQEANIVVTGLLPLTVSGTSTLAELTSEFKVDITNMQSIGWHATSTANWMKVTRDTGVTGQIGRVGVDAGEVARLPNFADSTGTLLITFDNPAIRQLSYTLTLHKQLPEIDYIAPQTRMPNEGGTYTVYGRGLDTLPQASPFNVTGATLSSYVRSGERMATVTLPPAAAGDVTVAANNALGLASNAPVLRMVTPSAFAYAAIPASGAKGGIAYDPVTRSVFTANKTEQAIQRFTFNGAAWSTASTSFTGVQEVALAPDGKSLVASAAPDAIGLFDLATVTSQFTAKVPRVGADASSSLQRLAAMGNGNIYYYNDVPGTLPFYDLARRRIGTAPNSNTEFATGGPWFSVSGDGARAYIALNVSTEWNLLLIDGSSVYGTTRPAGLQAWTESAQSLRGERFVEGTVRVWDRARTLIGDLLLPDSLYLARSPAVSPDGSRVFLLAYSKAAMQGGAGVPRVYVFDSRARPASGTKLPLLGYFDIADYPGCHTEDAACNARPLVTMSPDGKTLFFLGTTHLVVVPVPALSDPSQRAAMAKVR
jgi:hypothetical protein